MPPASAYTVPTAFRLRAVSRYEACPTDGSDAGRRQLQQQHGLDARRLSRFTQLALLGALPLRPLLPPDTAVFLASPFSSPGKIVRLRHKLDQEHQPSPLDFTANLHNAATFHLAQSLGLHGNSLFAAADTPDLLQILHTALLHLRAHPDGHALAGWAYERQQDGEAEGSIWWLLSARPHPQDLAELRDAAGTGTAHSPLPPRHTPFYPAARDLHRHLLRTGRTLLPARGIFPALVWQTLPAHPASETGRTSNTAGQTDRTHEKSAVSAEPPPPKAT